MKDSSRIKKLIALSFVILIVLTLTGCTSPQDENGQTIYIWNEVVEGAGTFRTSFLDVAHNENWFQAIIVYPLAKAINILSEPLGVGLAIAVVTILVNAVLAGLTIKSTVAQQQMQLIQPELEKIQRKYEGRNDQNSKTRQAQEMQKLYDKYNINPLSTILVTFIQFPVIIAMYQAVHRSYAVQTGTFLGIDLQRTPLEGIQSLFTGDPNGVRYLILFLVMAGCQFLATRLPLMLQRKKANAEAAKHHKKPEETSKTTQYMQYYFLALILVFGLMWPAAMSLYWTINSLVQMAKTLLTQRYIEKKEGA